jgi:dihydroflavonol-4-reductase
MGSASTHPLPVTLITGATGLVGSHLVRHYRAAGWPVIALKRPGSGYGLLTDIARELTWVEGDILDIPSLEAAVPPGLDGGGFDLIHAAALVSFLPEDRSLMERVNVEGTANVVNVCLKKGVRKLGFISSVAALGRPSVRTATNDARLIDESQKWEESPENSFYAKTKYRAELEVWRGVAEGLIAEIVCPSIVLGVGDATRSSSQLIQYAADGKRFYPAGLCNYVDVLDVADALFRLMQRPVGPADMERSHRYILNAGTIPYRALLSDIADALGVRPPSIRVSPGLARLAWPLEAVRAWLTGSRPLVTQETARSASGTFRFDGQKITRTLDFQYRPFADTLRRVASAYGIN